MAEHNDPVYDRDLEVWVVSGDDPGPAGVATWQIPGFLWVVDYVDPTRLVRCEVELPERGADRDAVLDLARRLLGPRAAAVITGAPRRSRDRPVAAEVPTVRSAAGWLAVARDELRNGESGDTLLAVDLALLSRQVGVERQLAPPIDADAVADALDDLDAWLLPLLRREEPAAARLLDPARAIVRSEQGLPSVDRPDLEDLTDILHDLALLTSGWSASQPAVAPHAEQPVLCQGLPAGAVVGATVEGSDLMALFTSPLRYQISRLGETDATVALRLGDRPAETLHLHAVRLDDGLEARTIDVAPFSPGRDPGTLRADVQWRSSASALLVSESPILPPAVIHYSSEAVHWGREAVRAHRRSEHDLAAELWATCAGWWEAAGTSRLARQASNPAVRLPPPSPFLRERRTIRDVVQRSFRTPGDPHVPSVADLLGYIDLAAAARMEVARAALEAGRRFTAMVNAARCHRDFARCGREADAWSAATLYQRAEGHEA